MQKLSTVAGALIVAMAATGAQAATVAQWNLDGAPGNQASTAGVGAANITALVIARGPGLSANAGAGSINAADWDEAPAASPAVDDNYFTFGFTVANGYTVDLDQLYIGTRSSGTGPGTLGLYYSGDNFSSVLTTFVQTTNTFVNSVVNLSALPLLTGINEFRIIQIGNISAGGATTGAAGTFRMTDYFVGSVSNRDLQFTGTVARVPVTAPTTMLMLSLALFGTAALGRYTQGRRA